MNFLSNIFKKKIEPKNRCMYACLSGDYIGESLVYINKTNNMYNFLALPSLKNVSMDLTSFKYGVDNNLLEKIKIIPHKYWKLLEEKYFKNLNNQTNNLK